MATIEWRFLSCSFSRYSDFASFPPPTSSTIYRRHLIQRIQMWINLAPRSLFRRRCASTVVSSRCYFYWNTTWALLLDKPPAAIFSEGLNQTSSLARREPVSITICIVSLMVVSLRPGKLRRNERKNQCSMASNMNHSGSHWGRSLWFLMSKLLLHLWNQEHR